MKAAILATFVVYVATFLSSLGYVLFKKAHLRCERTGEHYSQTGLWWAGFIVMAGSGLASVGKWRLGITDSGTGLRGYHHLELLLGHDDRVQLFLSN